MIGDETPVRWLIVCDCAGHTELVGIVEVDAAGRAKVREGGEAPSAQGANRLLLAASPSEREDLVRKIKTREIPLRITVSFHHSPCGKSLRVNEPRLSELLAAVSKAVEDQRISLKVLCAVNGRLPGGATR